MAIHGKATGVLIGAFDPSKFLTDYTVSNAVDTAETTGFQMQAKEFTVGQSDATVSFSGRYQGSQNAAERVFDRIQDNSDGDPFYIGTNGWVPGTRVRLGLVLRTGFDVSASVGDVVSTSGNLQSHGGVRAGWSLGRGDIGAGTYPGYAIDTNEEGADRWSQGAVGTVHCMWNTFSGPATITIQHSVDNNTWADVPGLSFPLAAGAAGSQMRTTTTNLARYVRTMIAVPAGTTGAANVAEAVARN